MQHAATALVGEHDFRNLSILDPAKQITDLALVSEQGENAVYVLDLVGSAFLYHQVRYIMTVMFLVGAGLESPSIVPTLMNVDGSERPLTTTGAPLPIVDRNPEYQMADALGLRVCIAFRVSTPAFAHPYHHFLAATAHHHTPPPRYFPFSTTGLTASEQGTSSAWCALARRYIQVVLRKRLDYIEVANTRWRTGKSSRRIERADAAYNSTDDE